MSNIYNIQQDLLNLFDIIEENEGEITPEIEEQLNITYADFKDKIKSYTDVIKYLNNDITAIKEEKARLDDLQKSKEKTIERLKTIIVNAIELFGTPNKSGNKVIDFGTGKVSIKNTQSVDVDEDSVNKFVNKYITGLHWYAMQNQLDKGIVDDDSLLNYANQSSEDNENLNFSLDDISKLDAKIDLKISIKDLIETNKGFNLAKALIEYNDFSIKGSVNKTAIKNDAKTGNDIPIFAKIINNKNVIIK